jgi:hypothetical protein
MYSIFLKHVLRRDGKEATSFNLKINKCTSTVLYAMDLWENENVVQFFHVMIFF